MAIESPRQAIDLGIGMVHQHFMLVPVMTVAENIVLASEPRKGMLLDTKAAARRVRELSDRFGLSVDPDARVGDISVGQQQRVEILRALDRGAEVLILDEPTAVLTAQETAELFKILRTLTAEGKSIVFISHKLGEVLEIADRVSVLRRGKKIETVSTEGATEESLARMMVGRDVLFRVAKERAKPGAPLLEVVGARGRGRSRAARGPRARPARCTRGRSSASRASTTTARASWSRRSPGLRRAAGRHDPRRRRDVTGADVRGKLDAGIGHIAEDRHRRGLVLDFSLAENLCLRDYRRAPIAKHGLISPKRMNERAAPLLEEYDVRGGSCEALALSLSGGNQQKVVIAREIAEEPKVLIAAQPTRGLDVGAIEFVHRRLIEQRDAGRGGAARLARARGDPLAVGPRARHVRRPRRRRARSRGVRGGVRGRDARRPAGGRVSEGEGEGTHTVASQLSGYLRAGGIITPLLTALIAFFIGGLVVALTGSNPFTTYKAIFEGSGLNWLLPVDLGRGPHAGGAEPPADAHPHDAADPHGPGGRLRVPRRPVQHRRPGPVLRRALHRRVGRVLARRAARLAAHHPRARPRDARGRDLCGGHRGLPQGDDRRQRGDHDDHAQLRRAVGRRVGVRPRRAAALGRRVGRVRPDLQRRSSGTRGCPCSGATPSCRACTSGSSSRCAALVVFWVLLNRSVAGYEARAVGFNPDAAEYGGIHAGRTYTKVMLVCGAFAGLAGVIDVLGWQFAVATNDIQNASVVGFGFIGIAVALLGRNTTSGVLFSALLFGALINGTSVRNLDPEVFPPQLATNLTLIIQGLIVLLVSAPVIVTALYKLRPRRTRPEEEPGA